MTGPTQRRAEDLELRAMIETIRLEQDVLRRDHSDFRIAQEQFRVEQQEFRADLKANTALTVKVNELTSELVDLFTAAKGAFKVLGWIGTGVKWVSGVAIAAGALWFVITHSGAPPK